MNFDLLRRLFSRSGPVRRKPRQAREFVNSEMAAERLEERTLLTPFYDLEVLASTSGGDFDSFGDLVSITNVVVPGSFSNSPAGAVAFVGVTDANSNGELESGLWTVDSNSQRSNVNPTYSDTDNRDFGRAVDMNENGTLTARDRFGNLQYFVRAWESSSADAHENIGSANSLQQPDYGEFSALQTFTDVNDNGDIVYIGLSLDGSYRVLMIKPVGAESKPFFTIPLDQPEKSVPRPQLTEDGRVLYRATSDYLALLNFQSGVAENVAPGFTNIGYASGISKDGRLISFIGDNGGGLGVYLAYQSGGTYKTVRVAGAGEDGWTEFDPLDAVRVNNTLLTERGVTVAYEGVHGTLGRGVYTTRVSFIDSEGPVDWDPDYTAPYVQGAVPVVRVGETIGGQAVTDVEFWNGLNDRNRGELAFWVETGDDQKIVRAEPWQVVSVDFTPVGQDLSGFSPANASLLTNFGLTDNVGWDANFSAAMYALGRTALAESTAQTDIVNKIESYFQDANARVRVVGRSGESLPAYVPWTGTTQVPLRIPVHGVYQSIFVGGKQVTSPTDNREYGMASPLYAGQGGLDYFNQITDDFAVVFADRIFASGGVFTNPGTVPYAKLIQAIAAITAHEIGHNFGLYHLEDDIPSTVAEIMRTTTAQDADLGYVARFSDASFPRDAYVADEELFTPGSENSVARLKFGAGSIRVGSPAPVPADALALNASADSQRANLPYTPTGQGPTVARLLVGVRQVSGGDLLPEFQDLGEGDINQLLAAARLSILDGTEIILLGSTDGTSLDIVGVPNGTSFDLAGLDQSFLGITADSRLQATFDPASGTNGFQLYHVPATGAPELMGAVTIQNVPELKTSINGATIDSGSSFGMGETTPGGGVLSRVVTIRNSGSGPLVLGTVVVTGAGYSVTQPAQSTLTAGQETTFTVTLSDGTAGIGLEGHLIVPSNDPAGAFTLTLRGTIDSRPRVLSVTRQDNGTGPIQVAINFSGLLQVGPAGNPDNYSIVGANGETVPLATAVYSQVGLGSKVVLTTAANQATLTSGNYVVRFDGTKVVSATGAPLATTRENLLSHQVWESIDFVTIGANGSGAAAVLTGPEPTGFSPPKSIVQTDLNGDGILDFAAVSEFTGEVVLHFGQDDGSYETRTLPLVGPAVDIKSAPQSILVSDWNSDGVPDLVVFDQVNDYFQGMLQRIVVLLNDGHGAFADAPDTPIPVETDASGPLLGVGDYTGDGQLDVAVGGPPVDGSFHNFTADGSVAIYGRDQFVGYSQVDVVSTGHTEWRPDSAVSADLNGDGRLDLVVATGGYYIFQQRPVVYLGTATGLVLADDLIYGGESGNVTVGDFTGDGKQDIAIINDNYSNSSGEHEGSVISLLVGNGSGKFTARPNILLNRRGVSLAATGDINQDGKLDLVMRADPFEQFGFDTTTEMSIWVLLGNGFGDFDLSMPLSPMAPTGNVVPGNFVLQDMTGDGYPELSFGNLATGQYGLFLNDGAGQLSASPNGLLRSTATAFRSQIEQENGIIIADLNRDGFPDQLRIVSDVGIFSRQAIDVFWGNATGGFEIVSSLNVESYEQTIHGQYIGDIGFLKVGDLNNDGWLDLVLGADSGVGGPLGVYLGVDGRNFTRAPDFLVDAGVNLGVLTGELADLNGDGNLDFVAVLTTASSGFGVFFGNGTGKLTYNANAFQAVPYMDLQIPVIADFNGDHKPDVAVGIYDYSNPSEPTSSARIYTGIGNGKFNLDQTVVRSSSDIEPQLYLQDVNGDGIRDILSPNESDLTLDIYLGSPAGQFTAAPELSFVIPYSINRLLVGDFTGDGFDDIAIAQDTTSISALTTTVPIFAGDGTGHFAEPQLIETGSVWPYNLALIPIAGTIDVGSFTITRPVLSVPAGAVNVSVSTDFERPVAVDPRPLFAAYTHEPFALAVSVEPSHGSVTVQANATPNNLNDDTFTYSPAPGFSGTDQFTYLAADGRGGTVTGVVTITVAPQNQNPQLNLSPGAFNYYYLGDTVIIDAGATVTDSDSMNLQGGKLIVQITSGFNSEYDLLSLEAFGNGPGELFWDFDDTLSYSGQVIGKVTGGYHEPMAISFTSATVTSAIVQAVLRHVTFAYVDFDRTVSQQRTITFQLLDGDGGHATATKTILVPAEGSNLGPVITTSAGSTVYVVGSPAIAIDDAMTVSDSDSTTFGGGSLTVDFSAVRIFDDRLAIRSVGTGAGQINLSGNTVKYGSIAIGTYSGGFVDSLPLVVSFNSNANSVNVQALMRQITFSNIDGVDPYMGPREIRFVMDDGAGGISQPAIRELTFVMGNAPPEITVSNGNTNYPADQSSVIIDNGIFVDDPDSNDFGGGSLTVDFVSGHSTSDRLAIQTQGTGLGQINLSGNTVKFGSIELGTYSGGFTNNSPLVISFNTNASPARVELFMRALTFQIASATPTTTNRVIRFVINDGDGGVSQEVTKTIVVSGGSSGTNESPTVQLPGAAPTFSKLGPAVKIDAQAIVLNPEIGTGTIGGGVLRISINDVYTGKKKMDVFNLTGLSVVGTLRSAGLINGRLVAVYDLDAGATAQSVQAALRSVTFQTSKRGLTYSTRTVQVQLTDSEGDSSAVVTKTIHVSKKKIKIPR